MSKSRLKQLRTNPLMLTDAYNLSHQDLKCNTDWEVSHMYNRSEGMILYGLGEIALEILMVQLEPWMIYEAEEQAKRMGINFPRALFERVINECNGYAPITFESLPEGTWCPKGTPFAQIYNNVGGFGELVTWFEAVFMQAYFPSSCATEAFHMLNYLKSEQKRFDYDDFFLWKFHSFGFRGHRSLEDAFWAGTAWSLFLHGTDDFHIAKHISNEANIGSISALAHKVTQQFDSEFECLKHAILTTAKKGEKFVALVIDTYDAYRVINEYLITLCAIGRKQGVEVHIVFRPDSGNTWEQAVMIWNICKKNSIKNASVIIGESMSFENAKKCDQYLKENGVPTSFVFYGIGGGFYNHITRDTLGWAMKTAFSNGKPRMKFAMEPIKRSIPGVVDIIDKNGELYVVPRKSNKDFDMNLGSKYTIVYSYCKDLTEPFTIIPYWEETRQRALSQNGLQERIYIDGEINEMIEQFKKIYV